jgi:hypothetical protein
VSARAHRLVFSEVCPGPASVGLTASRGLRSPRCGYSPALRGCLPGAASARQARRGLAPGGSPASADPRRGGSLACPERARPGLGTRRGGSPALRGCSPTPRGTGSPGLGSARRDGSLACPECARPGLGSDPAARPLQQRAARCEDGAARHLAARRLMGENPNCHPLKRSRTPMFGPVCLLMSQAQLAISYFSFSSLLNFRNF